MRMISFASVAVTGTEAGPMLGRRWKRPQSAMLLARMAPENLLFTSGSPQRYNQKTQPTIFLRPSSPPSKVGVCATCAVHLGPKTLLQRRRPLRQAIKPANSHRPSPVPGLMLAGHKLENSPSSRSHRKLFLRTIGLVMLSHLLFGGLGRWQSSASSDNAAPCELLQYFSAHV